MTVGNGNKWNKNPAKKGTKQPTRWWRGICGVGGWWPKWKCSNARNCTSLWLSWRNLVSLMLEKAGEC